jgi:hypothetical protein
MKNHSGKKQDNPAENQIPERARTLLNFTTEKNLQPVFTQKPQNGLFNYPERQSGLFPFFQAPCARHFRV